MATTFFDKDFTLDTKKSADSFIKFLTNPVPSIKIDKGLASQSNVDRGEAKFKKILSR